MVQLDSDMLVLQNMDELMDLDLDSPALEGKGERVFAAGHACVCNPLKKPHYPKNWYVMVPRSLVTETDKGSGSLRIAHSHRNMKRQISHKLPVPIQRSVHSVS